VTVSVPDPVAAVDAVRGSLAPGGRFVILDAQPFQWPPLRPLNPVLVSAFRAATDWVPEVDLVDAVGETFGGTTVETFNVGSIFVVRATVAES